ncbi:DHS-like NAD/FAD-binding domain-containing protein [Cadophora sp. DSE1049]|nr:DHS-like NAD/FAD-binding domain-containing protein [Cadophora sp. DSE1049]
MTSSPEPTYTWGTTSEINSFIRHLNKSHRILALCGAGLSAPSGIPTFKGSGSYWKNHKAAALSHPETFEANPGLVWSYFAERRRLALCAEPNKAPRALAQVARKRKGFVCLTQNVDGLSQRAGHPKERLFELHGSLMDIKCSNKECDYIDKENFAEPICPALAGDPEQPSSFSFSAKRTFTTQRRDATLSTKPSRTNAHEEYKYKREPNPLEALLESLSPTITPEMRQVVIPESELPHCPKCDSLLRPGVVWFGEALSKPMFDEINAWIEKEKKLDLMLVIGTMAEVYPAARFVHLAKEKGARVAIINLDAEHTGGIGLGKNDWMFGGDVEEVLEVLFEGVLLNG